MREAICTIFIMLLSGNTLFILYILFKRCLNYSIRSILLKICLVLFVVPVSYLVFFLKILAAYFLGNRFVENQIIYGRLPTIIVTSSAVFMNTQFKAVTCFIFLWIGAGIGICLYYIIDRRKDRLHYE